MKTRGRSFNSDPRSFSKNLVVTAGRWSFTSRGMTLACIWIGADLTPHRNDSTLFCGASPSGFRTVPLTVQLHCAIAMFLNQMPEYCLGLRRSYLIDWDRVKVQVTVINRLFLRRLKPRCKYHLAHRLATGIHDKGSCLGAQVFSSSYSFTEMERKLSRRGVSVPYCQQNHMRTK